MKIFLKIALLSLLVLSSSCAMMFGDKTDKVTIGSNPPGADIFIKGVNYGKTPRTISIEAQNTTVVLTKEGYGSTKIDLEVWATMKSKACVADGLTMMFPWSLYSALWSGNCSEFKEKEYFVTIPNLSSSLKSNSHSMMGVGKAPADMINYYYDKNKSNNYGRQNQYLTPRQQQNNGRKRYYGQ